MHRPSAAGGHEATPPATVVRLFEIASKPYHQQHSSSESFQSCGAAGGACGLRVVPSERRPPVVWLHVWRCEASGPAFCTVLQSMIRGIPSLGPGGSLPASACFILLLLYVCCVDLGAGPAVWLGAVFQDKSLWKIRRHIIHILLPRITLVGNNIPVRMQQRQRYSYTCSVVAVTVMHMSFMPTTARHAAYMLET